MTCLSSACRASAGSGGGGMPVLRVSGGCSSEAQPRPDSSTDTEVPLRLSVLNLLVYAPLRSSDLALSLVIVVTSLCLWWSLSLSDAPCCHTCISTVLQQVELLLRDTFCSQGVTIIFKDSWIRIWIQNLCHLMAYFISPYWSIGTENRFSTMVFTSGY